MAVIVGPDGNPIYVDDSGVDPTARQSSVAPLVTPPPAAPSPAVPFGPPPPPSPSDRTTPVVPLPPNVAAADPTAGLTRAAQTLPSVIPNALPMSRFALTRQTQTPTAEPGINPLPPPAPGYLQSSTDPYTGQPAAMNPSLTKLGKLLTVLRGAAVGGIVGSTQPTFGTGYLAAQQNQNQQINQNLAQLKAQESLGLVDTPWGALPRPLYAAMLQKILPAQEATRRAEEVQESKGLTARDIQKMKSETALDVASINHRYIQGPGGLYDTEKQQLIGGTAAGIPVDADVAKEYNLPEKFIGTRMKLTDLAAVKRGEAYGYSVVQTATGPVVVSKLTAAAKPVVGPNGQSYLPTAWAGLQQIADPDHPGESLFVPKTSAGGMAGTQSASMQIPKAIMKSEVIPGYGVKAAAFNTAIAHANTLKQAYAAVDNGDVQLWNLIKNKALEEFGWAEPPTARLVAEVYAGEVNNLINAGHLTQAELEKVGGTVPTDYASPGRMSAALNAYQSLAQSKLDQLNKQQQAAEDKAVANKRKPKGAATPPAPNAPNAPHPFFQKHGGVADPNPAVR